MWESKGELREQKAWKVQGISESSVQVAYIGSRAGSLCNAPILQESRVLVGG